MQVWLNFVRTLLGTQKFFYEIVFLSAPCSAVYITINVQNISLYTC